MQDCIPAAEYQALVDLYNSAGGTNWDDWFKAGWLDPSAGYSDWRGVRVNGIVFGEPDPVTHEYPVIQKGYVESLSLSGAGLVGSLPASLGNLSKLRRLELENNQLSGSIPASLGNLNALSRLQIHNNQLSGSIPVSLGNLSKLVALTLGDNQLTGNIPPELGNLSALRWLYLDSNQLTGNIPPELGNLSALEALTLSGNQLTGSIPPELGRLGALVLLNLGVNQLSGDIPPELGNLSVLRDLSLISNQLTGNIPPELGNLSALELLALNDNSLSANIPSSLGNLIGLDLLGLSENYLNITSTEWIDIRNRLEAGDTLVIDMPQKHLDFSQHRVQAAAIRNGSRSSATNEALLPKPEIGPLMASATSPVFGMAADGVTPLLLALTQHGETTGSYRITELSVSGGSIKGGLANRVKVLKNGTWSDGTTNRVTMTELPDGFAHGFAYVGAIAADDLVLDEGSVELVCSLQAEEFDSGGEPTGHTNSTLFRVRKPPVILLHGYNTDGSWDSKFLNVVRRTRAADFVRLESYGLEDDGKGLRKNTSGTLTELAGLVSDILAEEIEDPAQDLFKFWAVTRYDVIAHSQGGVLARMLTTAQGVSPVPPFRNDGNLNRGRFHRVVTIGSPHNGSTLLRYGFALAARSWFSRDIVPKSIAAYLLADGTLQSKFDPFGDQIITINSPYSPWKPDVDALFHLISTSSPNYSSWNWLLFDNALRMETVIPQGSDGVVDLASQRYGTDLWQWGTYVREVNHCEPDELFGAPTHDVASAAVATACMEALNGKQELFVGPFPTLNSAALNNPTRKMEIDAAAFGKVQSSYYVDGLIKALTRPQAARAPTQALAAAPTNYSFSLDAAEGYPMASAPFWFAEVFNDQGVSPAGLTVTVDTNNSTWVTVATAEGLTGDVVLYASYESSGGKTIYTNPVKVVSLAPPATLIGLSLLPKSDTLSVGDTLVLETWGVYDDGIDRRLYVSPADRNFITSDASVVEITADKTLMAKSAGMATVQLSYLGVMGSMNVTIAPGPEIRIEDPAGVSLVNGGANSLFGNVDLGAHADLTFTIKNTGTANLTGLGITTDGMDAGSFSVISNPANSLSGPNGSTTFTVRFTPVDAGEKTAVIHIASNDRDENPFDIQLTGTGVAADPYTRSFVGTPYDLRIGNLVTFDLNRLITAGEMLKVGGKLPSGLKFNASTGLLTGTLSGKPGTYLASIQILQGKTVLRTIDFPITVLEFPPALIGSFDFLMEDAHSVPSGVCKITITSANSWSATLESAGASKTRSAKGTFRLAEGSPIAPITATFPAIAATSSIAGVPAVTVNLSVDGSSPTLTGTYDGGTLRGFRIAKAGEMPPNTLAYTLAFAVEGQDGMDVPAGVGWMKGSVSNRGIGTFKGLWGDGTSASITLRLSAYGQAVLWSQPYKNKTSYVGGIVTLRNLGQPISGEAPVEEEVWWTKTADAKTLSYPNGFPGMPVTIVTSRWTAPANATSLGSALGWRNNRTAEVIIYGAGLNNQESQSTTASLPTEFTLDDKFTLISSQPVGSPLVAWKGKVSKSDGAISGTLALPVGSSSEFPGGTATASGVLVQDKPMDILTGCGLVKVPTVGPKGSFKTAAIALTQ